MPISPLTHMIPLITNRIKTEKARRKGKKKNKKKKRKRENRYANSYPLSVLNCSGSINSTKSRRSIVNSLKMGIPTSWNANNASNKSNPINLTGGLGSCTKRKSERTIFIYTLLLSFKPSFIHACHNIILLSASGRSGWVMLLHYSKVNACWPASSRVVGKTFRVHSDVFPMGTTHATQSLRRVWEDKGA